MTQVQPTGANAAAAQTNASKTATNAGKAKEPAANSNQLLDAAEDMGFTSVVDKVKDKRQKGQQQQIKAIDNKKKIQQIEDRQYQQTNFVGPQQTKKNQRWKDQFNKANQQNQNALNANINWQKRGIRETSFEVKTEWDVIQEFTK